MEKHVAEIRRLINIFAVSQEMFVDHLTLTVSRAWNGCRLEFREKYSGLQCLEYFSIKLVPDFPLSVKMPSKEQHKPWTEVSSRFGCY
jgi:hypothetical protein